MLCVRGEADIQDTPAHVTSLHRPLEVEAPPSGVIQADVLVCSKKQYSTRIKKKIKTAFDDVEDRHNDLDQVLENYAGWISSILFVNVFRMTSKE